MNVGHCYSGGTTLCAYIYIYISGDCNIQGGTVLVARLCVLACETPVVYSTYFLFESIKFYIDLRLRDRQIFFM